MTCMSTAIGYIIGCLWNFADQASAHSNPIYFSQCEPDKHGPISLDIKKYDEFVLGNRVNHL